MAQRSITMIIVLAMILITSFQKSSHDHIGLSDQDITNIHALISSHKESTLAADWAADILNYTEDAIRFPPGGDPIKGLKSIREGLEVIDRVISFNPEIIEIEGCGEIAYVLVKYSMASVLVGSTEPMDSSGTAMLILKKQEDNSWKYFRVMWN